MRRLGAGGLDLGSPPTRPMWASATSSRTRRKWCDTSVVTAGSSSRKAVDELLGGASSSASGVADRLAHVIVEQLDRALGDAAHRRVGVAREREQVAERQAELQHAQGDPDDLDVAGRVPHLAVDLAAQPDALRSTAWISEAGTPLAARRPRA